MTSQKRDPYRDKYGPFLQKLARALYANTQFAISSACPFSIFRSIPVSKYDKDPWEYNVEQMKT